MSEEYAGEVAALKEFKAKTALEGMYFKDMRTIGVHKRPNRGNATVHFNLSGNKTMQAHVSELAPGGCSRKHRHLNEAIIYIACGKGYSTVQEEGKEEIRVDWEEGDIFSPPLNAWHQHFNTDPERPARYFAVTTTLLMEALGMISIERYPEGGEGKK